MSRGASLGYGVACYLMFLGVFLYGIGFVGNLGVPHSIDSVPRTPTKQAVLTNLILLAVFALQHSVMARPTFKNWSKRFIPPQLERSTYVLFSNVCLLALFCLWEPVGGVVWDVQDPLGYAVLLSLFVSGWMVVLITTFLIDHLDLLGLRQVWTYFRGETYEPLGFFMPAVYQHVRHPLYVGWLIAFWATPTMTVAHLLFAVITTVYILVAIQFEERNLIETHGDVYVDYRRNVPMLIPRLTGYCGEEVVASKMSYAA
jgi:protein-S-isoprenylcysteine O-methyltransferase Ste14